MIRFNDLRIEDPVEQAEIMDCMSQMLSSGQVINGSSVSKLEQQLVDVLSVKYAFATSSGTSSLVLALMALGVGAGDKVLVPALSWISTAHSVRALGAEPIFCDIDEDLNISISSVKKMLKHKPKALIIVHFMGRPCQIEELKDIEIPIIEDCAQAFLSSHQELKLGSIFDIGCFSFNPMKQLAAMGEAGAVVTNNENYVKTLDYGRYCGMESREKNSFCSLNHRIDTIQAALLLVRLKKIETKIEKLAKIADFYTENLDEDLQLKKVNRDSFVNYYGYTLRVQNREKFQKDMLEVGIETKVQHSPLMCEQVIYKNCVRDISFASKIVKEIVCLPFHQYLSEDDLLYIVEKVKMSKVTN